MLLRSVKKNFKLFENWELDKKTKGLYINFTEILACKNLSLFPPMGEFFRPYIGLRAKNFKNPG
jgi:hypothetical protein